MGYVFMISGILIFHNLVNIVFCAHLIRELIRVEEETSKSGLLN